MKKSIFILVLTIIFISCQNEFSLENGDNTTTTPPALINDSILISRVVGLDTTKIAPLDTLYVANYTYDNLKRVITYSYLTYGNTGSVDSAYCFIASKKYIGNDTLPYLQINLIKESNYKRLDSAFYQYATGTSTLIKDSTITIDIQPASSDIYCIVEKYTSTSNSLTRKLTDYLNNTFLSTDEFTYNFLKQNGNIVTQQDNSFGANNNFSCTYDNKINPFFKPGTSPYSYAGFFDLKIGDKDADPTFYEQKNNVIEINNSASPSQTHYTFSYRYNSRNYPSEVIIRNVGSTNNFNQMINKIKFSYRN